MLALRVMHEGGQGEILLDWRIYLRSPNVFGCIEMTANAGRRIKDVDKLEWTTDSVGLASTLDDGFVATFQPGELRTYICRVSLRNELIRSEAGEEGKGVDRAMYALMYLIIGVYLLYL